MATLLIGDDLSANRAFLVALLRDQGHRLLRGGGWHKAFTGETLGQKIREVLDR